MKFNKKYFLLTSIILIIEILIALYVHDLFIRPYFGDILVVILMYCFIKSFFDFTIIKTAIGVLLFAFLIEFLQYLEIISTLGLEHNKIARTVIGTSFSWEDILCYIVGIGIALGIENKKTLPKKRKSFINLNNLK